MADVPQDAPEECPGTESEQAGKATACEGCPNQSVCSSAQPKPPDPAVETIKEKLSNVKHKILVVSGKGGVGKSTLSAALARGFALDPENQVALLDIDICGPSVPRILGVEGEEIHPSGSGWSPIYVEDNLSVMSTGFLLSSPDDAVMWRGPKKNGLIKQFLQDVDWGQLDYLVIDTPPGTSDEHLSVVQYLKGCNIDGAVVVTTPQEIALLDVRKEISFCRKVHVPIIGIVENMSSFTCPKCTTTTTIFPPSTGGGEKLAEEMKIPFLGKVPLDPRIGRSCDEGTSFYEDHPTIPATLAYKSIVEKVESYCKKTTANPETGEPMDVT